MWQSYHQLCSHILAILQTYGFTYFCNRQWLSYNACIYHQFINPGGMNGFVDQQMPQETTRASNFKIYQNVALDSRYILTGNDVIIYLRQQQIAQMCSFLVMFGSRLLDNGSIDFKKVHSFGMGV